MRELSIDEKLEIMSKYMNALGLAPKTGDFLVLIEWQGRYSVAWKSSKKEVLKLMKLSVCGFFRCSRSIEDALQEYIEGHAVFSGMSFEEMMLKSAIIGADT